MIRLTKALFVVTVAYFIGMTLSAFILFWWIWFQAYLTPDKTFRTIILVDNYGEANLELVMFIGWIISLVVISWAVSNNLTISGVRDPKHDID